MEDKLDREKSSISDCAGGHPGKKKTFFYSDRKNYVNLGDIVINRQLVKLMRKHGTICALSEGVPKSFLLEIGLSTEECFNRGRFVLLFLKTMLFATANSPGADVYVLLSPGGTNACQYLRATREIVKFCLFVLLRIARVHIGHFGHSIAGFTKWRSRYERLFRTYAMVQTNAVRDTHSKSVIEGIRKKAKVVPDLAFLMDTIKELPPIDLPDPYIVINFRPCVGRHKESIIDRLQKILAWADQASIACVFFSWQTDEDSSFTRELYQEFQHCPIVCLQEQRLQEQEYFMLYRSAVMVFSNRLHTLLFTWIQGGLPIGVGDLVTDSKFVYFLRDASLDQLILDLKGDDGQRLNLHLNALLIEKAQILEGLNEMSLSYRHRIEIAFTEFVEDATF